MITKNNLTEIRGTTLCNQPNTDLLQICEKIGTEDWVVEKPDPKIMGPFAYNDQEWVGYDDEDAVAAKVPFFSSTLSHYLQCLGRLKDLTIYCFN